jgi:hypothetical protein
VLDYLYTRRMGRTILAVREPVTRSTLKDGRLRASASVAAVAAESCYDVVALANRSRQPVMIGTAHTLAQAIELCDAVTPGLGLISRG